MDEGTRIRVAELLEVETEQVRLYGELTVVEQGEVFFEFGRLGAEGFAFAVMGLGRVAKRRVRLADWTVWEAAG